MSDSVQFEAGSRRPLSAHDWAMLVVRLTLGVIFVAHGSQKVLGLFGGNGLEKTIAGFTHMGIPLFFAYLACFTEFLGGLAVLAGLLSRLASLGLISVMVVAVATVHGKNGFFLNPEAPGFEYNIALIGLALAIVIAGPGRIAMADLEGRLFRKTR